MWRSVIRGCAAAVALMAAGAPLGARQAPNADGRDADRAAIRAHIESIFQALIDGDIAKIRATHSDDWRGFLESSRAPIKGIGEYMRANGIPWPPSDTTSPKPQTPPPPSNAPAGKPSYAVKDFDVQFYGPDLGVACFFGEFNRTTNGVTTVTNRLRIMDVYGRRNGAWIQVASHTIVDPSFLVERYTAPIPAASIPAPLKQQLLDSRDAVWRAYFANDRAALDKLLTAKLIAIDEGSSEWHTKDDVLKSAAAFAAGGGRLVTLEFPKTDIQFYLGGNMALVYTTYRYDLDHNGTRSTTAGRATEMFARRAGSWVNVGWHLDTTK